MRATAIVAVEGWAETSALAAADLGRRFEDAGVAAIVYTDIARDGMLQGVNWDGTIALAQALTIPVIASGGLASMADIERLCAPDAAILEGAITGRALYDGRIDPATALARLARALTQQPVAFKTSSLLLVETQKRNPDELGLCSCHVIENLTNRGVYSLYDTTSVHKRWLVEALCDHDS